MVALLMVGAFLGPIWMRAPDLDESRVLAPAPAWPHHPADFRGFRKAADAYVADHFPVRPHLIGALNRLRMLGGVSGSRKVIVGHDGWLFHDDDSHLGPGRGEPPWIAADTRAWLEGLAGRTEYLRARGVPYLVLIAPLKETVYPQYAPDWFRLNPDRPALRMARLARQTEAGDYLYVHDPIARSAARGVKTYSLHDTHWTGLGAYEGYAALMRRLQALGFKEAPRPLSDFTVVRAHQVNKPRNLALMLGVASFVDVDYPELENPADQAAVRTTWLTGRQDWTAPHVFDTGAVGKPVLLITMDSFSNALMPFLFSHFSRIVVAHNQDGSWRPDLIERFKPDVVVLEVLESGLGFSLLPAPAASAAAKARIDQALTPAAPPVAAKPPQAAAPRPRLTAPTAEQRRVMAEAKQTPNCNLERAEVTGNGRRGAVELSGWMSELAPVNTSPLGFAGLQRAGADRVAALRMDLPRPDVGHAFNLPAATRSGFLGRFPLADLPAGAYVPWAYRRAASGWIACKGKQTIVVP